MLFMNAATLAKGVMGSESAQADTPRRLERLRHYVAYDPNFVLWVAGVRESMEYDPKFQLWSDYLNMFADFDYMFNLFVASMDMDKNAKANGARMKTRHSLVAKWPYRVTENSTREFFDLVRFSNLKGWERYVEFERAK
jgi:hypothetical protein